jgi:hypothetical protein
MIKYLLHFFAVPGLLTLNTIIYGQDHFTREVKDFYKLSCIGDIRVELYRSDTLKLDISVKGLPSENLITEVKNGELSIRLKTGSNKDAVVKVKVFCRSLDEILVASGGLVVSPEIISGTSMDFKARSGGKMELDLDLESLEAEVSQGGILVFRGEVKKQEINVGTGATYSGYLLEAEDSYVKANSGGKAKVRANRIIEANSSSAGFIGYIGDPASEFTKTSLGGEIVKYKNNEAAGIEE